MKSALPNDFLTLKECCNVYSTLVGDIPALRRLIQRYRLTTYKTGRGVLVSRSEFEREVKERCRRSAATDAAATDGVVVLPAPPDGLSPKMAAALKH